MDLLSLAIWMQGTHSGVSLDDIESRFGVKRSTAERMLRAVRNLFPYDLYAEIRNGRNFWHLKNQTFSLVFTDAEELAHLAVAEDMMQKQNRPDVAAALRDLSYKLRGTSGSRLTKIDTDLDALLAAEGLSIEPENRAPARHDIYKAIRNAFLKCRVIDFQYKSLLNGITIKLKGRPYGWDRESIPRLLCEIIDEDDTRLEWFDLSRIEEVRITDEAFVQPSDFSMNDFTRKDLERDDRSARVAVRFAPRVAQQASRILFYRDQQAEFLEDGSCVVRFWALGVERLSRQLSRTWGPDVRVEVIDDI